MARVADAELCERTAMEFAKLRERDHIVLVDRAVGSVRTLGLIAGALRDLAVVEVVWDGRRVEVSANTDAAKLPAGRSTDARALQNTLFVLARRAGVATKVAETFSTARCANCGAHDTGGIDARCPYCAAPRVDDTSQWLVTTIVHGSDPVAQRLRGELKRNPRTSAVTSTPSVAGLLAWAIAAARVDGRVDERERDIARKLGERFSVSQQRVDALLGAEETSLPVPLPRDDEEARDWLRTLCELTLLDGTLHHREQELLRNAAAKFSIPPRDFDKLLAATRATLYREAR